MMFRPASSRSCRTRSPTPWAGNGDTALAHAVSGDGAEVPLDLVGPRELVHARTFELLDDVGVVHDLAGARDGMLRRGFVFHDLHGAANAHAKAHFARSDDLGHP